MSEKSPNNLFVRLSAKQDAPPWALGETILALLVLGIATILIGSVIAASSSPNALNPEPISLVFGWLIGLVIVIAFVLVRWRRTKEKFDALALGASNWSPLLAILIGIAAIFTANVLAGYGSGNFTAFAPLQGIDQTQFGQILLAALFLLVQAVAEGLIFWGIILPRLRASTGAKMGLVLTVAVFAAYYYLVFGERLGDGLSLWYGVIAPLIVGFTLASVRVWSNSTRTAILAQIGVGIGVMIALIVV